MCTAAFSVTSPVESAGNKLWDLESLGITPETTKVQITDLSKHVLLYMFGNWMEGSLLWHQCGTAL